MNIALWVIQSLLAFAFFAAGMMKIAKGKDGLVKDPKMGWAADFSGIQVRLIGLVEVLGALGLILPRALDILPILTPVAALGLVFVMAGAVVTHVRRNETAHSTDCAGSARISYWCWKVVFRLAIKH